ncbi:MAG: hypothetical protein HY075_14780 [Deltaproteobacteria bacterium]|nr:hypothetical protein [Deltaproteobacteria bacterium]
MQSKKILATALAATFALGAAAFAHDNDQSQSSVNDQSSANDQSSMSDDSGRHISSERTEKVEQKGGKKKKTTIEKNVESKDLSPSSGENSGD